MIRTVAASHEHELDQFCRRARTALVGALSLYLGDPGVAEELANESLLRAVDRWGEVGLMANPDGWVHTVAFNLARSRWRRLAAERRAHARLDRPRVEAPDVDPAQAVQVRAALARLSPRQRQAVVYRYFLDYSTAATARAMECTEGTVKAHVRAAMKALRVDQEDE